MKLKFKGLIYNAKRFYSVKATNDYLSKNPDWGVLATKYSPVLKREIIYVAHCKDMGVKSNKSNLMPERLKGGETV